MDRSVTTPETNRGSRNDYSSSIITHGDTIDKFKAAMLDAGVTRPETIIGDGKLHRFKIDGKLNGAYVLHLDGRAAGYFQDFKQGIKESWKADGKFQPLSSVQRRQFAIERQRQESERQAEEAATHKAAASKAAYIWHNSKPAPANHPYLIKKRIQPHSARSGRDNTLIVPLYNANKKLVNLQFIGEAGVKRFLSGGKKKGCFSVLGKFVADRPILICEGWATGVSLHKGTGHFVVVAMDAGNLEPVALEIRHLYPDAEIIICGDNDKSGVGQAAARAAALAVKGKYLLPPIAGMDFNDTLTMGAV